MRILMKLGLGLIAIAILLSGLLLWYRIHYSMERIDTREAGASQAAVRILIASQGSAFKQAVVEGLVDRLKARSVHIKIVDVSTLPSIDEREWHAIVILHTWENWRPQPDAAAFVARVADKGKLVVLSTSGSGREQLGVDAISAASSMQDVAQKVAELQTRLDKILAAGPAAP